MNSARLYDIDVVHHRQTPIVHQVRQRGYLWFVDIDHLPHVPFLARFDSADHIGDPACTIRANLDAFLAKAGVDIHGGQITMLTQARSLGYAFNPLTLFWCHLPSGEPACVVAEVHNTYGERHAYLLFPDDAGNAETDKAFYVSPFYPVDGYYRMSVPEPGERLAVTITLHRSDGRPFVASVRGRRRSATTADLVRLAARHPFSTQRVRAGIVRHGITLYLKGLPVMTRPGKNGAATTLARVFRNYTGDELPIRLRAWDGSEAGASGSPVLVVRSRRALRRIAARPNELGLARAYVSGELDVEGDLADGLRQVWAAMRASGDTMKVAPTVTTRLRALGALARLGAIGLPPRPPTCEARVAGRLHTRDRDRAVVAHHYDLSNDFYQLLLDESMAYSAAYFGHPEQPLADAQRAKLDLICRKLALSPGMRLLDVGCGWGSLILHAAEHYGAYVTGITLSSEQRDFVAKRVAERGLAHRVHVLLCDYRDLEIDAPFDAVSSIEMGEHVGQEQYPIYAATLHRALAPGGRLLLQQMSRQADTAPGGGPFVAAYIAPDMHMRPVAETVSFIEQAGLDVIDVEDLRVNYVHTARAWLAKYEANYAALAALVGEQVARVWRLYLAGGALSFEEGRMGVEQITAVRPA